MRARYLRAVLRHDIEYLDLEGATTSEVITSISGERIFDSRCPRREDTQLHMELFHFHGKPHCGIPTAVPTALLLILPGLVYGRMLVGLVRKSRIQQGSYRRASRFIHLHGLPIRRRDENCIGILCRSGELAQTRPMSRPIEGTCNR